VLRYTARAASTDQTYCTDTTRTYSKRVTRGAAKYRPFSFAPVPIRWHSRIPPAILGGSCGTAAWRRDRWTAGRQQRV